VRRRNELGALTANAVVGFWSGVVAATSRAQPAMRPQNERAHERGLVHQWFAAARPLMKKRALLHLPARPGTVFPLQSFPLSALANGEGKTKSDATSVHPGQCS